MKRMPWFVLACVLSLAARPTTAAEVAVSPEEAKRIAGLVSRLGNPSFREREDATQQLVRLGRAAKAALVAGAEENPDTEVRARCRRILPIALELDRKARLDAFLADKEGKQTHDLGGWEAYRKLVGEDATARELFADMYRINGEMLDLLDRDPKAAGEECDRYARGLYQRAFPQFIGGGGAIIIGGGTRPAPDPTEVATVLFLHGAAPIPQGNGPFGFNPIFNLFYQGNLQSIIQSNTGKGPAMRKLVVGFIDAQGNSANAAQQALQIVINLNLKECVGFAVKMAGDKKQQVYVRGMALVAVGKVGTKEHIPNLDAALNDDTQFGNINVNGLQLNTQLRDVALAATIKLSGQQPRDYGFEGLQLTGGDLSSPHYAGFANDEKRQAARKKWADHLAAEKK